jgi:HSP90 family molecular chaperone
MTRPEQVPDLTAPKEPDGSTPMKTVMKRVVEWHTVNEKKPLWLRSPRTCTQDDYNEFYKQTFKAFDLPAAQAHFAVEGNVDFRALLYVPSEVPYELTKDMFNPSARSMRLYVRRVFINDKFEDLIPRWLIFLRGVVDSDDLPLNVGREILQQSRSLRVIKQRLIKKTIDMFNEIATKPLEYQKFWKNFGKYLKLGVIDEEKMRDELVPLLRFYTSSSTQELTSLPEYVRRMPPDQKYIYYVVGETKAQAAMSPALERLRSKGYEVIYISEPVDEMCFASVGSFMNKAIVDAAKEISDSESDEEKKKKEESNEELSGLRLWIKQILGTKVTKVEASTRLVNSPATIIQSEYGVSPNMQRYLKAQAVADSIDDPSSTSRIFNQAVFELNPEHPIVLDLKDLYEHDPTSTAAKERVELLFQTAALSAGYLLDNSVEYAQQVVDLMTKLSKNVARTATSLSSTATDTAVEAPVVREKNEI